MKRSLPWLALTAPLLLALALGAPAVVQARPGGGHSYGGSSHGSSGGGSSHSYSGGGSSHSYSSSSGSSYSSGGGGGGGGNAGGLCPLMMVLLVVGVFILVASDAKRKSGAWSTSAPVQRPDGERPGSARERLTLLRMVGPPGPEGKPVPFDPDFSLVPFEDFLYALYARAHEARGGNRVDTLGAYLSERARAALRRLGQPARVEAVVVGAMQYLSASTVRPDSTRVNVRIRFEANYTEVDARGAEQSYYVAEDWALSRATAVRSRTPERARVFQCPNCGAPLEGMRGNTCSYCEKQVDTGEFDWVVESVGLVEREARGPQLGGDTPEEGTELPTVRQPLVDERLKRMLSLDPALTWEAFEARLGLIFQELQVAWSNRQWERVRPYVSDGLFQSQLYWMEAYLRAGLRNVTENARITRVEVARVVGDKYYHALTVRLFATSLDYTVRDSDGQGVSGSRTRERRYSEYWTLIRGARTRGRPSTDKRCPSCGAPLSLNMAGNCTHCSAKVTSGDFDWVLSRIEQDESYQG